MSKHHYIPQFYLKGFTDPTCPPGQEPYIWVYERGRQAPRKKAPKNIASELHYYSARTRNGLDTTPEVLLARIESDAAPILKKLANLRVGLTEEERQLFALFITLMFLRVPGRRKIMENVATKTAQKLIRERVKNKEVFKRDIQNIEKKTGQKIDELSRDFLQRFFRNIKLTPSPNVSLYHIIESLAELAPFFANMNWLILTAQDGGHFITNDRPVVLFDTTNPDPFYVTGLAMPNAEVSFPLTRNACLLATWMGDESNRDADAGIVEEINKRTAAFAMQFVFSSENSTRVQKLISHHAYTYTEIL